MITTPRRMRAASIAAATAVALSLSACAGGSGSAASGDGSDALTVWLWPNAIGDTVQKQVETDFADNDIQISTIGDNFKQKLVTTFSAKSGIPSVTGVKGEDMPYFLSEDSLFTDLNTLGIDDLLSQFPEWKLAEATTADGRLIGLPMDIGPSALYYRTDVLEKAGLPTDPEEVAKETSTWDDYLAFGQKLNEATGAHLTVSLAQIFSMAVAQSDSGYVDEDGNFTGDSDAIRSAWDTSVKAYEMGLDAGLTDSSADWASAVNAGTLPTLLGAAWYQGDLKNGAPDTSGLWNVTSMPGGPANIGGSFLTIPASTTDTDTAIAFIREVLSAENQATTYSEVGNFPSVSGALDEQALTDGDDFFGGQVTAEIFKTAIENMPTKYTSPYDSEVSAPYFTELANVESQGKDPEQAWNDAVTAAKQALTSAE